MPKATRRYRRKSRRGLKFLIWLVVLAIFAGSIVFFVTNYYEDTKNGFEKASYPLKYSEYVEKSAEEYNLDPALVYAVIRTESSFNPEAESAVGACGIMQMMPSSFEWLQEKRGCAGQYDTEDLFNPEICIDYGCYLLRYFYDLYEDEICAVAAYNAGFVVGDWLENPEYSSDGITLDNIPYPETSNYVDKVESAKEMYIKLYYSDNNI